MLGLSLQGLFLPVWYDVESEATLLSIPERPYVHFKHDEFWLSLFINSVWWFLMQLGKMLNVK